MLTCARTVILIASLGLKKHAKLNTWSYFSTPVSVACSYMRSRDRLLKIMDLYQQNQDHRLRKITLGLQTKRTRLQPRCGPLDGTPSVAYQYHDIASQLYLVSTSTDSYLGRC